MSWELGILHQVLPSTSCPWQLFASVHVSVVQYGADIHSNSTHPIWPAHYGGILLLHLHVCSQVLSCCKMTIAQFIIGTTFGCRISSKVWGINLPFTCFIFVLAGENHPHHYAATTPHLLYAVVGKMFMLMSFHPGNQLDASVHWRHSIVFQLTLNLLLTDNILATKNTVRN